MEMWPQNKKLYYKLHQKQKDNSPSRHTLLKCTPFGKRNPARIPHISGTLSNSLQ